MFTIIAAVLAGVCIVLSRIVNARLGESIGVWQSTFYNYITGLSGSLLLLLLVNELWIGFYRPETPMGWVIYGGGLLGIVTVVISNIIAFKLPALQATLFIFSSELAMGIILDYAVYGELSYKKILGTFLVLGGLLFNVYVDYKDSKKVLTDIGSDIL